jgi:ribonuclease T2
MRLALLPALAALLVTPACGKQASSCTVPADLPRPMLEGPTVDQPRRVLPITGYTLALSWSPQYCASRSTSPQDHIQCGGTVGRFGFTLHGLWPDGKGGQWPQYCRPTRLVSEKLIRENLCGTPSPQLIQHEWEKHGTCMVTTPAEYFDRSGALYRALSFPDMAELRGRTMTAADFQKSFAEANEGMRADQMRLGVTKDGWLEEVRICLNKRFARRSCPPGQGGAAPQSTVKIR